jgi:hypothetical protein
LETLSSSLKENKQLKEINISNNALGRKGIIASQNLLSNQNNLERLYAGLLCFVFEKAKKKTKKLIIITMFLLDI